ncbi:MAG: hypothetical protein WAO24_03700 [Peptococcia bacterium]
MIISPNGFWLIGKPHEILNILAELSANYTYVSEILSDKFIHSLP